MPEADAAIAQAIEDDGTLSLKQGDGNIVLGPMRSVGGGVPQECAFVSQSSGPDPQLYFPTAANAKPVIRIHGIQVMYRGKLHDTASARATARLIWVALDRVTISGVVYVHMIGSGPISAGLMGEGMELFSLNCEVAISE